MPVRPEDRGRYPRRWRKISKAIRARAGHRCEWCGVAHDTVHPVTGARVVIAAAHIGGQYNPSLARLAALCGLCHNRHDTPARTRSMRARRRAQMAVGDLFAEVAE